MVLVEVSYYVGSLLQAVSIGTYFVDGIKKVENFRTQIT